jgi:hypothetical protein
MEKKHVLRKKLTLSKETLRSLEVHELVEVVGRAETEMVLSGDPCKRVTCAGYIYY